MDIAALIISIIALVSSLACLVIMLAKNFFSSHTVQLQPVDHMAAFKDILGGEVGKPMGDQFRDLGDPIDQDEIEHLERLKEKQKKKFHQNSGLE